MTPETNERSRFLAERRAGIGGSDAAAILGLSPWSSPLQVWLEKRGEAAPDADSPRLWWGRQLEEPIALRYELETGRKTIKPARQLSHPSLPFVIANPDRLCVDEARGVEIKTAGRDDDWGEPGSDEVPTHYLVQCAHYMAVTDCPTWDVAVLFGGSDFCRYTIHRDLQLEDEMLGQIKDWWQHHIVDGVRPRFDGSERTRRWLNWRFPENRREAMVAASPEQDAAALELRFAREMIEETEAVKARCENLLREAIGEADGIKGTGWHATWKRTKDSERVDWESVARDYAAALRRSGHMLLAASGPSLDADGVIAHVKSIHTERRLGSRRFLFRPKEAK